MVMVMMMVMVPHVQHTPVELRVVQGVDGVARLGGAAQLHDAVGPLPADLHLQWRGGRCGPSANGNANSFRVLVENTNIYEISFVGIFCF